LVFQEADMSKHLCQRCRDRKARFRYRGVVCADRDHTLCFQCFRRERDRFRARRLAESQPLLSPFASHDELNDRQVAHRQRMLQHLGGSSTIAL
jgi:hypothetical protein